MTAPLALLAASLLLPQQPEPPAVPPVPPAASPATLTLPAFTGYPHPKPNDERRHDSGKVLRAGGELRYYLRTATPGRLDVTVRREAPADAATPHPLLELLLRSPDPAASAPPTPATRLAADRFQLDLPTAGYHCLVLRSADGSPLRNLLALELAGPAATGAHANTAERRNAASVHLGYPVPKEHQDEVEWFYIEITPRTDPLWSYYMATGWHRGYFGMQVNSPTERRLIFSVWDAGDEAVDRKKVAAENRVQLVAKGDGVVAHDFGNEGTGGHSHLVHDWKLGPTYRFLLHGAPDGNGTTYSGWFWFAERGEWGLIASFRAPKDGKAPRGLYSFNENFAGQNGDLLRDCEFGNAWVRLRSGEWLPLRQARFTHDETGKEVRLDRCGGVRGERWFLQNGGFQEPPEGAAVRGGTLIPATWQLGKAPRHEELPTPPQAKR
jgi:hypothetical protein